MQEELVSYEIDLGINRREGVNESFLAMFGGAVKVLLRRMFGGASSPVKLRGTKREVDSFVKAITSEKKYISSIQKHGLDDPRTFRNKFKLDRAVKKFTKETGLPWPIK